MLVTPKVMGGNFLSKLKALYFHIIAFYTHIIC